MMPVLWPPLLLIIASVTLDVMKKDFAHFLSTLIKELTSLFLLYAIFCNLQCFWYGHFMAVFIVLLLSFEFVNNSNNNNSVLVAYTLSC